MASRRLSKYRGVASLSSENDIDVVINGVRYEIRSIEYCDRVERNKMDNVVLESEDRLPAELTMDLNRVDAVVGLLSCLCRDPTYEDYRNKGPSAIFCTCCRPIPDSAALYEHPRCCGKCRGGLRGMDESHDKHCDETLRNFERELEVIITGVRDADINYLGWDGWSRLSRHVALRQLLGWPSLIILAVKRRLSTFGRSVVDDYELEQ